MENTLCAMIGSTGPSSPDCTLKLILGTLQVAALSDVNKRDKDSDYVGTFSDCGRAVTRSRMKMKPLKRLLARGWVGDRNVPNNLIAIRPMSKL